MRQSGHGYQYGTDTVWQKEFEDLVPFDETADQLAAIDATKADMESTKIMDRLVCGDVGYGKTEIAIRAAFKAVQTVSKSRILCRQLFLLNSITIHLLKAKRRTIQLELNFYHAFARQRRSRHHLSA